MKYYKFYLITYNLEPPKQNSQKISTRLKLINSRKTKRGLRVNHKHKIKKKCTINENVPESQKVN